MQELLSLANHLADEAGTIITRYYRTGFAVDTKTDESPVTVADRSVEARLREILEARRPEDGIYGEEYGVKDGTSGYTWVLDPIDGTKSFVIGRPTFGTLISLCRDGVPVLGIIDQPILKERWAGMEGQDTTFNRMPVRTRPCPDLKSARTASTSPVQLPGVWEKLNDASSYMIWGGDCYSYGLLANGWLDAVVEDLLAPYDFLALPPIVKGAGGWMGDWNGQPLTLSSGGKTLAIGNPALKDQFLDLLK